MPGLASLINITITTENVGVQQAGFGIPLILSAKAVFTERIRFYTDITGVFADFATSTPEYKSASAMFAQDPKPSKIAIGRLANKPTQKFSIAVQTIINLQKYRIRIGSTEFSFTADASAINDEIADGLAAAISAACTAAGFTVTTPGSVGSHTIQILADAVGNWLDIEVLDGDLDLLRINQTHVDPGVDADLQAIKVADNSWYCIVNSYNSKLMAEAIATFAETAEKLFIAHTIDSDNAKLTSGSDTSTSLAAAIKNSARARTAVIYHPATNSFIGAAWAGKVLPMDPGSETWAYKTLSGVAATKLTDTDMTNLEAKFATYYVTIAGVNVTLFDLVGANEHIDVIRFRDWLKARISERIFGRLAAAKKIPYTDAGVGVIQAEVLAQLSEGVRVGGLSDNPAPACTVPTVASVSAADKQSRTLRNVKFSGTLAGAIHKLVIQGVISV